MKDVDSYRNHLRLNKNQFEVLLYPISTKIQKQDTVMRAALPALTREDIISGQLTTNIIVLSQKLRRNLVDSLNSSLSVVTRHAISALIITEISTDENILNCSINVIDPMIDITILLVRCNKLFRNYRSGHNNMSASIYRRLPQHNAARRAVPLPVAARKYFVIFCFTPKILYFLCIVMKIVLKETACLHGVLRQSSKFNDFYSDHSVLPHCYASDEATILFSFKIELTTVFSGIAIGEAMALPNGRLFMGEYYSTSFWSMCFEAKHRKLKETAHSITSRKNITFTISMKQQLKYSYKLLAADANLYTKADEIKCYDTLLATSYYTDNEDLLVPLLDYFEKYIDCRWKN
ncbi:hypothetical protein QTP88_002058 [Uroleucon formosanum]